MKKNKVIKHLKDDIKTFKEEAAEDRKLIKDIKHSKKHKKDPKPATKKQQKVKVVMKEFSEKKLRSGSKRGPVVTNPKQALAIAYSEADRKKKKKR